MVKVQKLNGTDLIINAELIETIESTPDTIVTLQTGKKLILKTKADDLVENIIEYKKMIQGKIEVIEKRIKEE